MMENYEPEDYPSHRRKSIMLDAKKCEDSGHDVQIATAQAEFIATVVESKQHKQNYDFGAEIELAPSLKQQHSAGDGDATAVIEDEASKTKQKIATTPKETSTHNQAGDSNNCQMENEEDDDDTEVEHNRVTGASDDDDTSSTDSDFSDLSGLSEMSGREWKPLSARPINWVQRQIHSGANPRDLLSQMLPSSSAQQLVAPGLNEMTLWRILASLIAEPPRRQKLRDVNTFDDVVQLIQQSSNIMVLTGAGVSVSCGIPDFRSSDGIYSRLAKDFPDLPDPQAMFDITYFSRDPRPFYRFAREIYPGQFKPSPCHRFIKLLEANGKLLRNYTQNIDTLEQVAGIERVIECHGSFATASCTKCRRKCGADAIRADIFAQRIPVCPHCQPNVQQSVDALVAQLDLKQLVENGIMKPDIVFFGEGLPQEFHTVMASDKDKCDLLIVMGSSLKVRPVALIPSSIPARVPQILINREQLHHLAFDVELLGDSDVIINQLCHRLGDMWQQQICFSSAVLRESKELLPLTLGTLDGAAGECGGTAEIEEEADTQSLKSNASTDFALRSDSGFESSTSSGVVVVTAPPPKLLGRDAAVEAAEFQPFTARLSNEKTLVASTSTATCRHLSIEDKDSGIQGDSSNSALATTAASAVTSGNAQLLPPVSDFGDSGGTQPPPNGCTTVSPTTRSTCDEQSGANNGAAAELNRRRTLKRQSAAERLMAGTYYCHESSASYVFPGAQVSWCSDTEGEEEDEAEEAEDDEDDNDDEDEEDDECDDDDEEGVASPLSPLLPPSVEAEMANENDMTTTTAASNSSSSSNNKRQSSVRVETVLLLDTDDEANVKCCNSTITTTATTTHLSNSDQSTAAPHYSPPPLKRRRTKSTDAADSPAPTIVNNSNNTSPVATTAPSSSVGAADVESSAVQQF